MNPDNQTTEDSKMRCMVYNHFKENAAQNGCELGPITADGIQLVTVDKGETLAALKDGIAYRIDRPRKAEIIAKLNLIDKCNAVIDEHIASIKGDPTETYCPTQPAIFALVGRIMEWHELRAIIDGRKADRRAKEQAAEHARAEQEAKKQAEALEAAQKSFMAGESITAGVFETLLTKFDIPAHMRTIGWMRKHLVSVCYKDGSVSYRTYKASSNKIGPLARQLVDAINEATNPEPVDPEIERLFKR